MTAIGRTAADAQQRFECAQAMLLAAPQTSDPAVAVA